MGEGPTMTTCDQRRSRSSRAPVVALMILLASLTSAAVARAQAEDQAAARVMFEQGRELMKAGQYAAACPKLEAARKLYTSAGILLNLADCHEKTGKTASAWAEFGEAVTVATRTNRPDDADEARRRKAALETSLARIVIRVPRPAPGMVVKRDGAILVDLRLLFQLRNPDGGQLERVADGDAIIRAGSGRQQHQQRDKRRGEGEKPGAAGRTLKLPIHRCHPLC